MKSQYVKWETEALPSVSRMKRRLARAEATLPPSAMEKALGALSKDALRDDLIRLLSELE